MEKITINFDEKNYYIIAPRKQVYTISLEPNRIRIIRKEESKTNRKELANKMYDFLKQNTNRKERDIWKAIAETDDYSLLDEFEKNNQEPAED